MINPRIYKTQRAKDFLASSEGKAAYADLRSMEQDKEYKTDSTYSPSSKDGCLLFIDKHMNYLATHKSVNSMQYISNLKLIAKIRN